MQEDTLRRGVAEFLGSFGLTFIGAGSIVTGAAFGDVSLLSVAIAHGLVLAIMVTALGHISGAHFNPAITFGFLIVGRIDRRTAVSYWISQFAGGVFAALLLRAIYDGAAIDATNLGAPGLSSDTSVAEGLLVEIVLTFFLVLVVFATAVDPDGAFKLVGGFAIGLTIGFDILMGGPLTGAAMNPQRAFGPQLVANYWSDGWIYYLATPIGAAIAALLYDRLYLRAPRAGSTT